MLAPEARVEMAMARVGRHLVAGQRLHVIRRGNDRKPVFLAQDDYAQYRERTSYSDPKLPRGSIAGSAGRCAAITALVSRRRAAVTREMDLRTALPSRPGTFLTAHGFYRHRCGGLRLIFVIVRRIFLALVRRSTPASFAEVGDRPRCAIDPCLCWPEESARRARDARVIIAGRDVDQSRCGFQINGFRIVHRRHPGRVRRRFHPMSGDGVGREECRAKYAQNEYNQQ